jgi:hypothetical protein
MYSIPSYNGAREGRSTARHYKRIEKPHQQDPSRITIY